MTERARREYAEVMRRRYHPADKRERGRILDEYCRTTGCHRKAAIRRLRATPAPARRGARAARRATAASWLPILERAWLASDQLSGKLLRPDPARAADRPADAPRRAAPAGGAGGAHRRQCGHAGPAAPAAAPPPAAPAPPPGPGPGHLRAQVPLRTWSEWTGVRPGAVQGDLVLHCGESTAGRYCATLVAVDVATKLDRTAGPLGPAPSTGHRRHPARPRSACPSPCASGTATMAASSSTPACSAGASATGSASPAAGPIARTTRPGSSSATACSCAASSATTATAPAPLGPSCSACTACSACSTTSSGPSASC